MYANTFKNNFTFEQRYEESSRVLNKFPDRIPIICERSLNASKDCPYIDRKKYLVPRDLTMGQLIYVIRKRLKLSSEKALFLIVNNNILSSAQILGSAYHRYKDPDGFLYVTYTFENTFG